MTTPETGRLDAATQRVMDKMGCDRNAFIALNGSAYCLTHTSGWLSDVNACGYAEGIARAAREDVAETVALPWKWPFGAESAARLVAHVSWPNDSQVDEWAPRLLDEPEIRESTIARAEDRFRQAVEAIRAGEQ